MRLLPLLLAITSCSVVQAGSPFLEVANQLIASPAGMGSVASQLAVGDDGTVFISWIEPGEKPGIRAFRVSAFDRKRRAWGAAKTVSEGADITLDVWSTPQIAVNSRGAIAALWYTTSAFGGESPSSSSQAVYSRSEDQARTWAPPIPLNPGSEANEFASLTALSDGRFLAVWLEPQRKAGSSESVQSLRGRILFMDAPTVLLDPRVCDCCATSVVGFPDGSALAVYRDRSDDEVRDISLLRFQTERWSEPRKLSFDHWKIAGCPVNGPAISALKTQAAAAWYTAAGDQPQVLASTSSDAGDVFLSATRIDDGHPLGQVDIVQLRAGTRFVSWIEAGATAREAAIWMRRLANDGSLSVPVRLAVTTRDRACGVPRLARLKDEDTSPAELLLSYTSVEGDVAHLTTRLLTIAPQQPDRLPCDRCPPAEERGSSVHGYIQQIDTQNPLVQMKYDLVPGLIPAGTRQFHVAPEERAAMKPGAEVFGRIEQRDDGWWLFGVRVVDRSTTR